MNHEPIEFLPVRRDWLKPAQANRTRDLCWGIVLGSALTVIVAALLIWLTSTR